jgi:hypothetical protein
MRQDAHASGFIDIADSHRGCEKTTTVAEATVGFAAQPKLVIGDKKYY